MASQKVVQHWFFRQWTDLRAHASRRGVRIVGDVPIFVAPDSADVWATPRLFQLDRDRQPMVVSGVPPDYFSASGQLWGNPIYNWPAMAREGFAWWVRRLRAALALFDAVRVDHFRGFTGCWEVPAGESTAVNGRWAPAPGRLLFAAVRRALGYVPLVAEDLGVITPEVNSLREEFGFPGMVILQFAFDAREAGGFDGLNRFLPHNHRERSVVYTGTHDNDTTAGWWAGAHGGGAGPGGGVHRRRVLRRAGRFHPPGHGVSRPVGGRADAGRARPRPGSEDEPARHGSGNWRWRVDGKAFTSKRAGRLRDLAGLYGRTRRERA